MAKVLSRAYEGLKNRPSKFRPGGRIIKAPDNRYKVGAGMEANPAEVRRMVVGMGASPNHEKIRTGLAGDHSGLGSIVDAIQASMQNPFYNMDVIEQVRWTMAGPQTDESVGKNFGAEIDLFGAGKSPEGIDYVETTMAQTGQTQTYFIACYIGFHIEPEPLCFTTKVNGWTHPDSAQAQPPSPDVFTANDVNNGCLGAAFQPGEGVASQFLIPGVLEWGWWANYVAWHMARGYNLRWKIGQHVNIMDEVLRPGPHAAERAGVGVELEVDVRELYRADQLPLRPLGARRRAQVNRIQRRIPAGDPRISASSHLRAMSSSSARPMAGWISGRCSWQQRVPKACPAVRHQAGRPHRPHSRECDTIRANVCAKTSISQGLAAFPPVLVDEENIRRSIRGSGRASWLDAARRPRHVRRRFRSARPSSRAESSRSAC